LVGDRERVQGIPLWSGKEKHGRARGRGATAVFCDHQKGADATRMRILPLAVGGRLVWVKRDGSLIIIKGVHWPTWCKLLGIVLSRTLQHVLGAGRGGAGKV